MKTKIILDTNFLLIPAQFGVDIFSELERVCNFKYELLVVPETLAELESILKSGKSSGKDKKAAKMALQLIEKYGIKAASHRKVFKRADEAILSIAGRNSVVATQDRELRKKLQARAVRLITLRQRQYLRFLGE